MIYFLCEVHLFKMGFSSIFPNSYDRNLLGIVRKRKKA